MPSLAFLKTPARTLGLRFASILAGVLVLALGLGFAWLALENREAALQEEKERLKILEHRLVSSLKPLMQTGNPDLIWTWLKEIRDHDDIRTVRILRRDGEVAFRDLETLERVNDYLGKKAFERSPRPSLTTEVPKPEFRRALQGDEISRVDTEAGIVTRLLPIPTSPQCQGCHGYESADYRGVLRVTSDLDKVQGGAWTGYRQNLAIAGIAALILVVTVLVLVRRQIIDPVKALVGVTSRLAAGDLEVRADAARPDELGTLARSFNRMADRLQLQMAELRDLINRSPNGIVILDGDGFIRFTNPVARTLLNRTNEDLLGSPLGIPLVTGETTEIEIRQPEGGQGVAEVSAQPIEWEGSTGYLVTFHDVTTRKEAEDVAKDMAYHDELTGLANRALFQDWLEAALEDGRAHGKGFAVLFLDLDRFKEVNDTLGHAAGDDLLQIVAGRLSDNVRDSDTVARLSGDEFCVLLGGVGDRETAREVAEKLLARLQEPVALQGEVITPAATIGISLFPEDGDDPETLLMRADTSMYNAKEQGRNRVGDRAAVEANAAYESQGFDQALQQALPAEEFELRYQPLVRLRDGRMVGVEALLRWHPPDRDPLFPKEFIPRLEQLGLMESVGNWIFHRAFADLRSWEVAGASPGFVSVNLSRIQLHSDALVPQVHETLEATGVPADQVFLEFTETDAARDLAHSQQVMKELRDLGVRLAIDDFGRGYSALGSLRRWPVNLLKIDLSLVSNIPEDAETVALVKAIIAMGQNLGLEVMAEGVETGEQATYLANLGCELAQGFYFGKPLSADEVIGRGTAHQGSDHE